MTLTDVLEEHNIIISREIINCVCEAIDAGVSSVLVVEFIIPGCDVPFDIHSSSSYYKKALQVNMTKMAELTEEYELCAKAKHYIEILESQKLLN